MPGDGSGEPRAHLDFEAFCENRRAELYRTFDATHAPGIDADDVVQDTLLIARNKLHRFSDEIELVRYCKVVGINLIRKRLRSGYNRFEEPHPDPLEARMSAEGRDSTVEQVHLSLDLARVLATLPKRQADALYLESTGESREEIAAILGMRASSVGKLLHRARRAAQRGWEQIVASLLVLLAAVRKAHRATSGSAQALVASVVSVTVVAVFAFPVTGQPVRVMPGKALTEAAASTRPAVAHPPASKQKPAQGAGRGAVAVLGKTATAAKHGGAPRLVPPVPSTCTSGVCVASSCSADDEPGDVLYLKAEGPCGLSTTEDKVPVCQDVPDNPVVGCQRRGKPEWKVDPPPPPSPKGEPL